MDNVKRLISGLILTLVFFTGCITSVYADSYKSRVQTFRITVTSTPDNSNVYLNDIFLGKTPLNNFPIKITYDIVGASLLGSLGHVWSIPCAPCLKYYLFIEHPGYYDTVVKFQFDESHKNKLKLILEQNEFDILLTKNDSQENILDKEYVDKENDSNIMDLYFGKHDTIFRHTNMPDLKESSLLKRAIAKAAVVSDERGFNYFAILSKKFYVNEGEGIFKETGSFGSSVSLIKLKIRMETVSQRISENEFYETHKVLKGMGNSLYRQKRSRKLDAGNYPRQQDYTP